MSQIKLKVEGMSCEGCSSAVERILTRAAPGAAVQVDLEGARASLEGEDLPSALELSQAIEQGGFKAREEE